MIIINDDAVIVCADAFIKHDGSTHRIHSLIRVLHIISSKIHGKKLVFKFSDGEPLKIVAFDKIVSDIVTMLEIDQKKIVFELIDHVPLVDLNFEIKLHHSGFFKSAKDIIKTDLCVLDQNFKMFGAFFGRFTLHRMLMAYYLETQISQDSLVAFQPKYDWGEEEIGPLQYYFDDQMTWWKSRRDRNINLTSSFNGGIFYLDCLPVYHEIFGQYAIEIILETNVHEMGWFTEKTTKCLASGKPFLLFGAPGQLQKLRDMGFQTYDKIINEQYDLEYNTEKRFDMICAEISRLSKLSSHSKSSTIDKLYEISTYNKVNYKDITDRYYQSELL